MDKLLEVKNIKDVINVARVLKKWANTTGYWWLAEIPHKIEDTLDPLHHTQYNHQLLPSPC